MLFACGRKAETYPKYLYMCGQQFKGNWQQLAAEEEEKQPKQIGDNEELLTL